MVRFLPIVALLPRVGRKRSGGQRVLRVALLPFGVQRRRPSGGIAVLEQVAAISQQHGNLIQPTQLLGIGLCRQRHLIDLERHGLQALLQFHQPLGEGCHGLGILLRAPAVEGWKGRHRQAEGVTACQPDALPPDIKGEG